MVNVFNEPKHWGLGTPNISPSLLRRSFLWDLVKKVEMIPAQHFLMRGYAFPGVAPASVQHRFPYPSIVQAAAKVVAKDKDAKTEPDCKRARVSPLLCDWEMRQVCGLGFHKAAISAVLLFAWSSTQRLDVD